MLRLKAGVKPKGMQPEILLAIIVARDVCQRLGKECVITSLTDGKHSKNSLHYSGKAVDLRTRDMERGEQAMYRDQMKDRLGDDYDVVLEKDHLHVEFDPK